MSVYDEIKEIPILDIAEKLGIQGKRNGALCFKGHDTTPSLSFNTRDNYFNCFGCGVAGDGLNLVKEYLTLDTGKAIEWVKTNFHIREGVSRAKQGIRRPEFSVALKEAKLPKTTEENYRKTPTIYSENHTKPYTSIYRDFIDSLPSVEDNGYLTAEREISKEVLDRNEIKRIPDGYNLTPIITKHGEDALKASGLVTDGFSFSTCDYVFPFFRDGQIVYLQGVFKDRERKYKNLAGRGKPLLYLPKQFSDYQAEVYIAEGVIDALSWITGGIDAVAIIDASISRDSERLAELGALKPFSCVIIGDNDLTGVKAEAVLAEYMLKHFFRVKHLDIQKLADAYGIKGKIKDANDLLKAIKEKIGG